ncbi:MAG: ribosome-associated translation inhibitor RaiA [Bacilli bacterium]|nr:ribosome-associated translation inhibitor RaiA [Bacilli bacterium]
MKYTIVGHGIEVTPAMKKQAIKKLARIEKYFDEENDNKCNITFSVGHHDQTVEIGITTKTDNLRAKVKAVDAYSALDLVIDKLEGQMRKMKTRLMKSHKRNSVGEDMRLDLISDAEVAPLEQIVKRKILQLIPMDAEEALARMEALDHDFFIYLDSTTGRKCVLYRRTAGNYGVIEIEE